MVVMGGGSFIHAPCMLHESITYIYTDMRDRSFIRNSIL